MKPPAAGWKSKKVEGKSKKKIKQKALPAFFPRFSL
jgi:hypothetical protein